MSELQELGTIFVHRRIWVDKDHPKSDDGNAGDFERPLKTYEMACHGRADPGDLIIIVQRDDTRLSVISQAEPAA